MDRSFPLRLPPAMLGKCRRVSTDRGAEMITSNLHALLADHQVAIEGDRPWQSRLRLLQALWAEATFPDFTPGEYTSYPRHGSPLTLPLGSRFPDTDTVPDNRNFLTPGIGDVVRETINDTTQSRVIVQPRIWLDLLSSQPMCFNLFGELKRDRALASRVVRRLWPDFVVDAVVTDVQFEWSPGRDEENFLDNRSAFDVIFFLTWPNPARDGFIGVETKYHETLGGGARIKPRYITVADESEIFTLDKAPHEPSVKRGALQQIWLDHLLALSMIQSRRWESGMFVLAYPQSNQACSKAAKAYRQELEDSSTFDTVTLETVVTALRAETSAQWVEAFYDRYLDLAKIDRALKE